MVVIALIGLLATLAPKSFFSKGNETKNEVMKFTALGQSLRSKARVKNMTYRIVFEFPKKDTEGFKYYIESSSRREVAVSQEELLKRQEDESRYTREEDKISYDAFKADQSVMKEPKIFPPQVKLSSVEYTHSEDPQTLGKAYVHFFPSGQVEEAAVHISNGEKLKWTIYFKPLTGGVEVISNDRPLKEIKPQ